jgi:hypothetical protein
VGVEGREYGADAGYPVARSSATLKGTAARRLERLDADTEGRQPVPSGWTLAHVRGT